MELQGWQPQRAVPGRPPPVISHLWARNGNQVPKEGEQAANTYMLNSQDALCCGVLVLCVQ